MAGQHITVKPIMHFPHSLSCLWLSLWFFLPSLLVGSYFISLSLSVPLSLPSLFPASKIFQWLETNSLREQRRHTANVNGVFLSESSRMWVWAKDMRTSIRRRAAKVHGSCWLVFGCNNYTLHPKFLFVEVRGGRRGDDQAAQGQRDKEEDWKWW